jgi:hypothetical protein
MSDLARNFIAALQAFERDVIIDLSTAENVGNCLQFTLYQGQGQYSLFFSYPASPLYRVATHPNNSEHVAKLKNEIDQLKRQTADEKANFF